jgi:hypothetical protein
VSAVRFDLYKGSFFYFGNNEFSNSKRIILYNLAVSFQYFFPVFISNSSKNVNSFPVLMSLLVKIDQLKSSHQLRSTIKVNVVHFKGPFIMGLK